MSSRNGRMTGIREWTGRSLAGEFHSQRSRDVETEASFEEEERMRRPEPRLELRSNPFLINDDDFEARAADRVAELQGRYEQEIQELDEAQMADEQDLRNRFLDRLKPGHAEERADRYADARDAKMAELGTALAELDYQEYGWKEVSNDEALEIEQGQESDEKGLDFEF